MTNGDIIRAMSDKELTVFFDGLFFECRDCPALDVCDGSDMKCSDAMMRWLGQEAAE